MIYQQNIFCLHFCFIYFWQWYSCTPTSHQKHNPRSFAKSHLFCMLSQKNRVCRHVLSSACKFSPLSVFSEIYLPIMEIIIKVYLKMLEGFEKQ